MSDAINIVCARISDAKVFVPGSTESKCGHCSEKVWIAPSTQNQIRDNGWKDLLIVCNRCVAAHLGNFDAVEMVPPTAEAISEICNMKNIEN